MSDGVRIAWEHAFSIAGEIAAELGPHVAELKCVGSVRRKRETCGDIEFVARPKMATDLAGDTYPILDEIEACLAQIGPRTKGGDRMLQIKDIFGLRGLKLDLYLVWGQSSWGSQLAIRTGPWELGRHCMIEMRKNGYEHEDGCARRIETKEVVPTETEEAFFALAGVPCVAPSRRDALMESIKGGRV